MSNNVKLIITEDVTEFSEEQLSTFQEFGISVIFCSKDGEELCEKIKYEQPDAVVMDSFMTRLDAIGVIHSIKHQNTKLPLFIVFSTFHSPVLEHEIMNSGASYFILKPYNVSELCDRIVNMVERNNKLNNSCISNDLDIEVIVAKILHNIGVPTHIKGYRYLLDSIIMFVEDPKMINAITKQLYPSVAEKYDTTSSRVERAIRHAIEVAWDRGNTDTLNSYFGYTISSSRGKPTNSEFISMIAERIRLKLRNKS